MIVKRIIFNQYAKAPGVMSPVQHLDVANVDSCELTELGVVVTKGECAELYPWTTIVQCRGAVDKPAPAPEKKK